MYKKIKLKHIVWSIFGLLVVTILIFMRFGGFSTGDEANVEEFKKYAKRLDDIRVPEDSKIIALGEASHGNIEFQELKLNVFKQLVEKYSIKAFSIEGDYSGSEQVNRYINGGKGSSRKAAAAIGFSIYRTNEMEELINYMREYNRSVTEKEKLRFYGFDMQRPFKNLKFLVEQMEEAGLDTTNIQKLTTDYKDWNSEYDYAKRVRIISKIKDKLMTIEDSDKAVQAAEVLLQYCELENSSNSAGSELRDRLMAENIEWIAEQERQRGYNRIFVSGHNTHVAKWGSYNSMGKILSSKKEHNYYVIGTDFYRAKSNLPSKFLSKRTNQVFYSHDPLAKASKLAKMDISWLDFDNIPKRTELNELINQYHYMGNLGEAYTWFMRILPPSYRIFQQPAVMYDSMIFISDAKPIEIKEKPIR